MFQKKLMNGFAWTAWKQLTKLKSTLQNAESRDWYVRLKAEVVVGQPEKVLKYAES